MTDLARILLCARGEHAKRFTETVRKLGQSMAVAGSVDEIRSAPPDLAILDFDSIWGDRDAFWRKVTSITPKDRVLVISSTRRPAETGEFFTRYRLTNFLARNGDVHEGDFRSTVDKLLRGQVFGAERYLAPGSTVTEQVISTSTQKTAYLEMLTKAATAAGMHPRVVENVASVGDEMFTNAVYDAPRGPDGRPKYAHYSRTQVVKLEPQEQAKLAFGADKARFVISVSDPFGSLTVDRVLDYLAKCFAAGDDQIDRKPGGAGLGLYFMFNWLSHFVINIDPGVRTEMVGVMEITSSYREFAERAKSFNLFLGPHKTPAETRS